MTAARKDDAPATGLGAIRARITEVDAQLLALLAQRRGLALDVAREKQKTGAAVRDPDVERRGLVELIRRGRDMGLDAHLVTRLFQGIIEDSVLLQQAALHSSENAEDGVRLRRVAFLGSAGSYSQQATQKYYARRPGKLIEIGRPSFEEVLRTVEDGEADSALLPIENSTSGSINDVYDLLQHTSLSIIGELTHKIEHCLLAKSEDATLAEIKRLYSHPQVYAQCSHFLARLGNVDVVYCDSTSAAMAQALDDTEAGTGAAAIGSAFGGELHGLHVIESDLANQKQNHTRFIVVARTPASVPPAVPAKTMLILSVDQKAGSLVDALIVFRDHGINMTKLESRPLHGNPWEELFYVDLEGNLRDPAMASALDTLARRTRYLKVLGCYPSEDVKPTEVPADALRRVPARPAQAVPVAHIPSGAADAPARWRMASRAHKAESSVIKVGPVSIGEGFTVIAGPSAVESPEQIAAAARAVREHGGAILHGGCFVPKTGTMKAERPGRARLEMLSEAGAHFGLPVLTQVTTPTEIADAARSADMLQIGAGQMSDIALLEAAGLTHRPILLRRHALASAEELLEAAERILTQGNRQIVLCEGGVRTAEPAARDTLGLAAVPLLKSMSHLPVIVDPTHAAARRELIAPLARAAKAAGADGLIVQVHPDPDHAQQAGTGHALNPEAFAALMQCL